MSRLTRRVAVIALAVLAVQFLCALAIQVSVSRSFRVEIIRLLTRSMEDAGALRDCTDRPGPWTRADGWWTVWPLTDEGVPIGAGAPVERVELPAPGSAIDWSDGDASGVVHASTSTGCGGLLTVEHYGFPIAEAASPKIAWLVALRLLLLPLAALTLVALTAGPLVRRIRALSRAMERVVRDDFAGSIADDADDELGEVARAFDAASASARERLERLEHRDALLRRAMADLAHDLRTPLATLQLSASGLPASSRAATIRAELAFLEGMTENFEALLGGDEGEQVEDIPLAPLLDRIKHRFAPLAGDRDLTFEVSVPDEAVHLRGPSIGLERALSNLVQNALRFARANIVLVLFTEGDEVRLEVRDDGPGFGDFSARAAERGVRGDEAEGAGFGLGLAIAEAAARRLGGRLELTTGGDGETVVAMVVPKLKP